MVQRHTPESDAALLQRCGEAFSARGRRRMAPAEMIPLLDLFTSDEWERLHDLHDAQLLRLFRDRYHCTESQALEVFESYQEWLTDAAAVPTRVRSDGSVELHPSMWRLLDKFAREAGVTSREAGEAGEAHPPSEREQ